MDDGGPNSNDESEMVVVGRNGVSSLSRRLVVETVTIMMRKKLTRRVEERTC